MQWQGRRKSTNVEDRRGSGGAFGGFRGRRTGGVVGGGLGAIALIVLYLVFGGDLSQILQGSPETVPGTETTSLPAGSAAELSRHDQEMGDFVSVVLADIEDVWGEQFTAMGRTYREPKLVLYSGATESACGYASAAVGPFYCPGDEKVYLDLSYFEDMERELEFEGDFALAYVIAHEVGHHVQNQLGIMDEVASLQRRVSESRANDLSVRLELQADFLAGVWAHYARGTQGFIDSADIEEGMNAASAVGDDRIQKRQQGYVVPDSFTHGSSAQRVRWFRRGLDTGDIEQGDTFNAARL
jgi:predicted metalloprotease